MTIEEATLKAHAMYAYETSEQADQKVEILMIYGKVFMMFVKLQLMESLMILKKMKFKRQLIG